MKSINFMTELTTYNYVFKYLSLFRRNYNPLAMNVGANRHIFKKNLTLFCFFPQCTMNASYSYYHQPPSYSCVTNWMVVPSTGLQTEAPATTSIFFFPKHIFAKKMKHDRKEESSLLKPNSWEKNLLPMARKYHRRITTGN